MKFPVEKVVGGSPEQKKDSREILKDVFEKQDLEGLDGIEVEKTSEMLEEIAVANAATAAVLEKYGINAEPIDARNIHVVRAESWPEHLSGTGAFFRFSHQCIILPDGSPKLKRFHSFVHEMFHFKSYLSAQVLPDNRMTEYRVGFEVCTRDGEQIQFTPINEAVTENLTYEAMHLQMTYDAFFEEVARVREVMEQHAGTKKDTGEELFSEQTFHAEVGEQQADGTTPIFTSEFTYQVAREGLDKLIHKLYEANKASFKDPEEVGRFFIEGAFTGNILKIGKLIDRTFGTGTFRKLGELQTEESFLRFTEGLALK